MASFEDDPRFGGILSPDQNNSGTSRAAVRIKLAENHLFLLALFQPDTAITRAVVNGISGSPSVA